MRRLAGSIAAVMLVIAAAAAAEAANIEAMDRVSVRMPKSAVVSILGTPASTHEMAEGLKIDLYTPIDTPHLVSAGYLYEEDGRLGGHAYVFQGNVARQAAARLKEHGFTLREERAGTFRLSGKDDDTGAPVVVTIGEQADLTTVLTFEKGFYDRRVQK
ncbi:MAG: hypothetical protein ACYC7J_08765 [Syntrophales bacterium]